MKISSPLVVKTRPLLGLLAALLLAWSLWWGFLAYELRHSLDGWLAERRAAGWVVTTGSRTLSGFPWTVRITLPAPSLLAMDGSGWRGPEVVLSLSPLAPQRLNLVAHGKHVLIPPGQPPQESFAGEVLAQLEGDRAQVSLRGVEALGLRLITGRLVLQGQRLEADLQGLTLPEDSRLVLGRKIEHLGFTALTKGSLAPTLAAWRDGSGVAELSDVSLEWQALRLSGEGTLTVDKRLQPLFAGTATIGGLFEAVQMLEQAGVVKAKEAANARIALQLLAKPGADGKAEIHLPLTVQDGRLYLGPVALMVLPDIIWPNLIYFRNE